VGIMEFKKHSYIITDKMLSMPVTSEAKLFYLSNCEMQESNINLQQDNGVDPPKVKWDNMHIYMYQKDNELTPMDIISIIDELEGIGVLDED